MILSRIESLLGIILLLPPFSSIVILKFPGKKYRQHLGSYMILRTLDGFSSLRELSCETAPLISKGQRH